MFFAAQHELSNAFAHLDSSRCLLEKVPNLVCGVKVAVGIAEQSPAVRGGMGYAVTTALNPDERHIALAGGGPALAFDGAPIARVGVGKLRACRRTAESVELEEVVDARLRGEGGPSAAIDTVKRDIAAVPDRKSTRLNSSHIQKSRMPSSA